MLRNRRLRSRYGQNDFGSAVYGRIERFVFAGVVVAIIVGLWVQFAAYEMYPNLFFSDDDFDSLSFGNLSLQLSSEEVDGVKSQGRSKETQLLLDQLFAMTINPLRRRTFACLRSGCRAREIEDFLDRGWIYSFKSAFINDTKQFAVANYRHAVLMTDTTTLNQLRSQVPRLFEKLYYGYEGETYLTAFNGADAIGGNKGRQLRARIELAKNHGCNFNDLGIQPIQYRLYVKEECDKLISHINDTAKFWLFKPEQGSQGNGISFHDSVASIQKMKPKFFPCSSRLNISPADKALVQAYIDRPLLIKGAKFDIRVYMVLARTNPAFVFFHDGYLRRSLTAYNAKTGDLNAHLTNTHFQSKTTGFRLSDHVWSLETFSYYLQRKGIAGPHFVDTVLIPYFKLVVEYIFHSTSAKIEPRRGTYQIIGLDFMIDSDLQIHFLEANGYPGYTWSKNFDSLKIVETLFELERELHELPALFQFLRVGDSFGSWSLVYSEIQAAKSGNYFDPCRQFSDNRVRFTKENRTQKLVGSIPKNLSDYQNSTVSTKSLIFIDRFPGWRSIGGEKGDTYHQRSSFANRYLKNDLRDTLRCKGTDYESWAIEPPTFRLYNPLECERFLDLNRLDKHKFEWGWILKHVEGHGNGDGLLWFQSPDQIKYQASLYPCFKYDQSKAEFEDHEYVGAWMVQANVAKPLKLDVGYLRKIDPVNFENSISRMRQISKSTSDERKSVKQENSLYLDHLNRCCSNFSLQDIELLKNRLNKSDCNISMHQFDLRVYMLVASVSPLMVFYHDGYLRSSRRYKMTEQFEGFTIGEQVFTFETFQYYLTSRNMTGPHYVSAVLRPYLFKVLEFVLHSGRENINKALKKKQKRRSANPTQHFHQLFALNFVIDQEFRVHLVGVAGDPESDTILPIQAIEAISNETKLVLESIQRLRREVVHEIATAPAALGRMRYGDSYSSLRLIFSEMEEKSYSLKYNPCVHFSDRVNDVFTPVEYHEQAAKMHRFSEKRRRASKREMESRISREALRCKTHKKPTSRETCLQSSISEAYLIFLRNERIQFDDEFVSRKLSVLLNSSSQVKGVSENLTI